jgi:RNA polymerase sigma-70 factor (ECF subfamily)
MSFTITRRRNLRSATRAPAALKVNDFRVFVHSVGESLIEVNRRAHLLNFDSIYKEFYPRIHHYLGVLAGKDDALDLTQTVFLKVSRSLDSFREESSLSTWIYRIATNTAHDHNALSLTKQKSAEQTFGGGGSLDDFPDTSFVGIDREYIRKEMSDCIRGIVSSLPENYRTVLLLSEFEGFTNSEISEILNVSIHSVKIRLHRARATLRKAMESKCRFYYDERSIMMCDRKK